MVESFMIAVSLAIAAVPEGLAAVVTISLALGMREMVRRHALIRGLASVETLGSATVICSDKTGTLTQNVMTVTSMWVDGRFIEVTGQRYEPVGDFLLDKEKVNLSQVPGVSTALWVSVLNNDAELDCVGENGSSKNPVVGDPTEASLLIAAANAGVVQEELSRAYPRHNEIPFDSARKRMITTHTIHSPHSKDSSPYYDNRHHGWNTVAVKGALDVVLRLCTHYQSMDDQVTVMDESMRQRMLEAKTSSLLANMVGSGWP